MFIVDRMFTLELEPNFISIPFTAMSIFRNVEEISKFTPNLGFFPFNFGDQIIACSISQDHFARIESKHLLR